MKSKLFILVIFSFISLLAKANPQFGNAELFNNGWKFHLSDVKNGGDPQLDDSKWRSLDLPHDWSVEGTYSPDKASCQGYLQGGIGWYRKSFFMPTENKNKKIFIYFEGVYNRSEVFVNGKLIGNRPYGYISFMFNLTPYLKFGENNVVAVKVDHSEETDSRWYTGSGIYRNVYLVTASPVHLGLWGVYFKAKNITNTKAEAEIQSTIVNESESAVKIQVINEIIDPANEKVVARTSAEQKTEAGKTITLTLTAHIPNPKRWSVDQPYLYRLRTIVKRNGKITDQNEQKIGFKTLTFDSDNGFALNGVWMKVKGVCIHHDAGVLGSAVPPEVWKRRFLTLKELGCNAIRLSHNPQAPEVYELCDELGLLIMDEAFDEWEHPKRKWIKGWNVGTPGYEGSSEFFKEWGDKDLEDMVLRDRNHPSVFLWSIGNEVDYPNDPYSHPVLDHANINQPVLGGYLPDHPKAERLGIIAKRLAAIVRNFDTSRPVTAALAGVVMSNETDYPFVLDVTGYNYTEDRYAEDHAKYPKRIIFGSENVNSMETWKAVRDNKYIFGQFIWTGIDYLGESGVWPSRGFNSGFLDFGGFIKPRGHFRQALWSTNPVTYIGTYPLPENKNYLSTDAWSIWNYNPNEMIRVVCYTNASNSMLFLNGKQIGETKGLNDSTGVIYWDIPYQAGKLEVKGFDKNNQQICSYSIQSSDRPHQITAKSDKNIISKNKGLAQITIQVLDDKGIPVMFSDDEITCTIEGPAKLLGLEASNNSDISDYTDNVQRVYHGRLLAYVQATGMEGIVTVKFTSPWLKSTIVTLKAMDSKK